MADIKVKFVSIEEGINALGFRRIAAIARKLNPDTEINFIAPGNLYSLLASLNPSRKQQAFTRHDIQAIARELAMADLLCFSSMSSSSSHVVEIVKAVKKKNPKVFVLWGGAHCILNPEEAIKYVDAVCTGEGEIPFEVFYKAFANNKPYFNTPSMWFKRGKKIFRNLNRPLNSAEELNSFPHLYFNFDCSIYDSALKAFRQLTTRDFTNYNGLCYWTLWTLGCPFSCAYCANNAFINLDSNYRKIRHPSVDYVVDEIELGIKKCPFISVIMFNDDNFITLPLEVIKEFAKKYKKRINLPFVITGLHPNFVTKEKMEVLGKAGMNRGRMGIQSGSEKILAFYQRPTTITSIKKSVSIIARAVRKYQMIPPAYDIISDNPIASREDVVASLKLLYELERPYTLTVFSLRIFPKTKLYDYFKKHPTLDIRNLESSYLETRKTLDNILLYILAIFKPPRFVFLWLLKYVRGYQEEQRTYPLLYLVAKTLFLTSRAIGHLKKLDFSNIVGPWGYYLWRMGFIKSKFRVQAKKLSLQ